MKLCIEFHDDLTKQNKTNVFIFIVFLKMQKKVEEDTNDRVNKLKNVNLNIFLFSPLK